MKKLSLLLLLMGLVCLGAQAFGQAARFDGVAQTTTTVTATNTTVLVPLPGATITWCGYPSNGTLPCTNKAAVCPDITGVGCTTGAPNNPVTADATGNFGAWLPSGSYDYTVCAVSGVCQGPYHAIVASSNGAQGVFTVDGSTYTTIQAAITAAGTTGYVAIPSNYAGTDTYTNPNKIQINDRRPVANRARGYINVLTDCGLKGDGATDDGAKIQACWDAYPGYGFIFPQTIAHGCSYFSGQTLYPKGNGVQIVGSSGSQYLDDLTPGHLGGVEICFPTGITGIWLDISAAEGEQSQAGAIRNLTLRGASGFRSLNTPTGLNVPSTLPQFTRNISAIQRAANVLTVSITGSGGIEGLTQQVGSTVKISGVTGDSTMNGLCIVATLANTGTYGDNPTTFTCPQNGSDSGPFTTPGTVSLPTTGASTADGIRVCSNFWTIDHVGVIGFERHGINADSQAGHGCALAFSDDMVIHDSMFMENNGDGFYCQGVDCNAGYMAGNTYYYNFLYGIEDQSSLGNTHVGEQISNNGSGWAAATTPATKAISTISRTLASNSSTVTVVLSVADTNLKQGSCVVIAGVTDSSFNSTAGQCFFITSFTNSTNFQYIQPGAPVDASSSGGTSRMAKFAEAYLSSGVDSGAEKIATQSPVAVPTIIGNYAEGGQICKNSNVVLHVGGVSGGCAAAATGNWVGQILGAGGIGLGGQGYFTLSVIDFPKDSSHTINVRAGVSADQNTIWTYLNHSNGIAWTSTISPAGTSGGTGYMEWRSGLGQTRMMLVGNASGGHNYFSAEGTGAIKFNFNFAGTNAGTGGVEYYSGGASPAKVASVDSTGLGIFNGGVKAGSSGSTISDSRALVQSVLECGTTTACANTANLSERMITGTVPLSSATPSTATITGISPAFTSTATYFCTATPEGATAAIAAGGIAISKVSGSSFTLTGPATVTTVIDYTCIGH